MLTADLVVARRRKGELAVPPLDPKAHARALILAEEILGVITTFVGESRAEVDEALGAVEPESRDRKMMLGLRKLALDGCVFEAEASGDPAEIRRQVFLAAAAARRGHHDGDVFSREEVLTQIASERGITALALESALFADLRSAHRLQGAPAITAKMLLEQWEESRAQAVLLRAVRVRVKVHNASSAGYRLLFRKLKFLRLLCNISREDDGYTLTIDGPYSLFDAVTKYGLSLALIVPALRECDRYELEADVRWGVSRDAIVFRHEGGTSEKSDKTKTGNETKSKARLPEELETLLEGLRANAGEWTVDASPKIVDLPGIGVCVPDLALVHPKKGRVLVEVMGYWSRAAVWKRVELVQQGLAERVLFAVSERLRVSEEVLGDELPSALYVYKGKMSAKVILERADLLASRKSAP